MSSVLSEYLKSIGRYPLLNKNQEIILGRRVQAWLNDPDPSPSVVRSGKRAQDKMIKCNLRLVVSVAKRYSNRLRRTELIDIIQEGTIGLTRGVQKFDPERGYALSTYVYWWIRQAITRYIQTNDRLIKLPNGGSDAVVKLREWVLLFVEKNNRPPSVEECAAFCKLSVARMQDFLAHTNDCRSLDHAQPSGDGCLLDVVADPNNEDMLDRLAFDLGAEFLSDMLHTLSEPEKFVVEHYYGITTKEPITLHAIGQIRGISRERVRQIHNRAIVKLRINSLGSPARSTA